jgi:hypothetical protein
LWRETWERGGFANELAPNKPGFTEKYSPPWMSLALFDYTGVEFQRTYGDEFGFYNFLVPSTYAINVVTPSGVGPKMHQFCLNHPGPIADSANPGLFIVDPRFRAQYSTTCYTSNFEAGRTTYLDTPVIRQAAFVGALQQTLSCEPPASEPVIRDVLNTSLANAPAYVRTGDVLQIRSMGNQLIRNPDFPGDNVINVTGAPGSDGIPDDPPTVTEFITRDFGFGSTAGPVRLGSTMLPVTSWTNDMISLTVPAALSTGQLSVTRGDNGRRTQVGLTVTVGPAGNPVGVINVGATRAVKTIQAAIDAANPGDLILVDPGIYRELPIVYKRVRLQGAGAGSTILWASHFSAGPNFVNPLVAWHDKVNALRASGQLGLLPEQAAAPADLLLFDGEGPGILVAPIEGAFSYLGSRESLDQRARVDGFKLTLADVGGGIYANAYADRLLVSNNVFQSNAGNMGGAVRVGNPTAVAFNGVAVADSPNMELDIRSNHIRENGSMSYGGGIALHRGADNYRIDNNNICGNFSRSGGGGIAHRGLNVNGTIAGNSIHFNEVFQGDQPGAGLGIGGGGGGIEVAGDDNVLGGLTDGTGDVTIDKNLIQGNLGGAADGGGIALRNINGADVAANSNNPNAWHRVRVFNNMVVNNVSGLGGGGIALQDAGRVEIVHNTLARNDSTATGVFAFQGGVAGPTTPLPAGLIARTNSPGLDAALPGTQVGYSQPVQLRRNIIRQNRSFFWTAAAGLQATNPGPFWDLGVVGVAACLTLAESLTAVAGPDAHGCSYTGNFNAVGDPLNFVNPYFNTLTTAAAADEGGNFVQVYFRPLGLTGNYHIGVGSAAINRPPANSSVSGLLGQDIDGQTRPAPGGIPDTGADEFYP